MPPTRRRHDDAAEEPPVAKRRETRKAGEASTSADAAPEIKSVHALPEWTGGSTQRVTWVSEGAVPKVCIHLSRKYTNDSMRGELEPLSCLKHNVANTGSADVSVPVGLTPGEYFIQVESSNLEDIKALSGAITIDRNANAPAIKSVHALPEWTGGSTQRVTWVSEGAVPKVCIHLNRKYTNDSMRGELEPLCCLKLKVANTGSADVSVPVGLTPGEYFIQVESSNLEDIKALSGAITIDRNANAPAIKSVHALPEWTGGSTQRVTWVSEGAVPKVCIHLNRKYTNDFMRGELEPLSCLKLNVANTGSADVSVPVGLTPGEYFIQVKSSNMEDVAGLSGAITVDRDKMPPALHSVLVQYPICHGGTKQRIMWVSEGAVPKVCIHLTRKHTASNGELEHLKMLGHNVANTGSFDVTVPVGLTPGEYFTQVQSSNMEDVEVLSDGFIINDIRRNRCVAIGVVMLGLPATHKIPYPLIRKIAILSVSD